MKDTDKLPKCAECKNYIVCKYRESLQNNIRKIYESNLLQNVFKMSFQIQCNYFIQNKED